MQEQGSSNPGALLQRLQAAQGSPRQQALLLRMLQESALGAAAREPFTARVNLSCSRLSCSVHPLRCTNWRDRAPDIYDHFWGTGLRYLTLLVLCCMRPAACDTVGDLETRSRHAG